MSSRGRATPTLRVLYSFPHPIGAPGIGVTALNQVRGLAAEGVEVTLLCTSVDPSATLLPERVVETMGVGGRRIPHRLVGVERAYDYHDWRTARWLERHAARIDLLHAWPMAARRSFTVAQRFGITAVRESPNTYTAVAYRLAEAEAAKVGVSVPENSSHAFDPRNLRREELEYELATAVLVPSDFVESSYQCRAGPAIRTIRHSYGFDPSAFPEPTALRQGRDGFVLAFVGSCEPRKGLHYAMDAWRASNLGRASGRFIICGRWQTDYRRVLDHHLNDPTIELRPFTDDVGSLLRGADALVLPSVEEGSALVTYEAQASGCALLVSDATGALMTPGTHGFMHRAGDVDTLTSDLHHLGTDRELLGRMRAAVLGHRTDLTWAAAARRLLDAYDQALLI